MKDALSLEPQGARTARTGDQWPRHKYRARIRRQARKVRR